MEMENFGEVDMIMASLRAVSALRAATTMQWRVWLHEASCNGRGKGESTESSVCSMIF